MTECPVLSVVTPVYNEQEIVPELIGRIVASCRPLGLVFEVVVVNDGSRDGTLERLVGMSADVPELRVIDLMRNFGHMPALSAGVALARGAAVVVMDGDLQDPPELIPRFLEEWRGSFVAHVFSKSRSTLTSRRCCFTGRVVLPSKRVLSRSH